MRKSSYIIFSSLLILLSGCMKWDYADTEDISADGNGLFIICEGNFQYGNASLSYYNPATDKVQNEIFSRANGYKLGDVAQSMVVRDGKGWIVVNNSHVVFAINATTLRETGRIENLPSPRYIHFVNDEKAYITQIWDNRIFIVNPKRYEVTGTITVPGMSAGSGSTEQMVQWGKYVYVNCWSYQNSIIKIDTETDEVVEKLTVGIQPASLALDCNGKLWTITDGGYEESPFGHENPRMFRIDAATFTIEHIWDFPSGSKPTELQLNGEGNKIYWINDDVFCMDVTSDNLPQEPIIPSRGTLYYSLTIAPTSGDIYVADVIDYQQRGIIYRYNNSGSFITKFYTGIIPGAFAWK